METYGMAAPDNDNTIDCYQQYLAQTGYTREFLDYGDHMRDEPRDCSTYDNRRPDWLPPSSMNYLRNSVPYAGSGGRPRVRRRMENNGHNPRNGLYSPTEMRMGGGDFYNSLPGLGNYERPMGQHARRNRWF